MRFTTFTLIAGAGLISAQSSVVPGYHLSLSETDRNKINHRISSGCKTALSNVLASPDAACLNPSALVSLVTGGTNSSIVGPINKCAAVFMIP